MGGEEATGGEADRSTCAVHLQLALDDPIFNLETAVCSHGLFMMAPNRWDPASKSLHRPLRLSTTTSSLSVRISQPSLSHPLLLVSVFGASSLSFQDQHAILAQVRRMLRISDENDRMIREFHELHAGAKESGFGRVFRSPTLFEDMVKCILLCNCQWPRTLSMARSLCELQLELDVRNSHENFHPKTPVPKELKRKRGTKKKMIVKLETKLIEDEAELAAEDTNSQINHDNQTKDLQVKETPSSTPLQMEETSNSFNSSELSAACIPLHDLSGDLSCQSKQIGDFPSPEELAIVDVGYLAMHCKVGYRAKRIVSLAQNIVEHKLHLRKLEEDCGGFTLSSYAELDKELSGICGFGPYTRANVLMCMGFYHQIPADSETIRHLEKCHAISGTLHSVKKDIESIYGKYAPFQFLAYWFELWDDYEKIFGKMSEMFPSDYRLITASNMKSKVSKKRKSNG